MAVIGAFGDTVFEVSNLKVLTFDDWKRQTKINFAEHKVINQPALLEFLGRDLEEISFTALFHRQLGVDPFEEAVKFRDMAWAGEYNFLVIGNHAFTENPLVITDLSETVQFWDGEGKMLVNKIDVSMKEYVEGLAE